MAPPRILLCGDVLGRLNQLFKRVQSVSKSAGPFDALLCVGQFFPDSPDGVDEFMGYMEGRVEFPIPTYFVGDYGVGAGKVLAKAAREGGNQGFKMDGLSVCEGLYWLKGSGKFDLHGSSNFPPELYPRAFECLDLPVFGYPLLVCGILIWKEILR
ncbi:Zinc finger CCCH domain-containing protein [Drosera capensis]